MPLKIISANLWGGHQKRDVTLWVREQQYVPGVFCLQEVHRRTKLQFSALVSSKTSHRTRPICTDLFEVLEGVWQDPWFRKFQGHMEGLNDLEQRRGVQYGNALFIHPSLRVRKYYRGMAFGYFNQFKKGEVIAARSIQAVVLEHNYAPYIIVHFHGLWTGNGKGDTPERLFQSWRVVRFVQKISQEWTGKYNALPRVVLCGDFNLHGRTTALEELRKGLSSLGREAVNLNLYFKETNTRTPLYPEKKVRIGGREADWMIVSPEVMKDVRSFKVIRDPVISDHCPLELVIA